MWGVSLTHPLLASVLSGEFLLHSPCWITFFWGGGGEISWEFLLHIPCWLHVYVGSFSYTSRDLGSFFYASDAGFTFMSGVSLTHPVLVSFYVGSFSYTSLAGFIFMCGVSLIDPVLVSCLYGEFLLHIPSSEEFPLRIQCWFHFYVGSFSYTSRAGFIFMWRVSLTHSVLASFLSREFLLHIPCWLYFYLALHFYVGSLSYTSRAGFILI